MLFTCMLHKRMWMQVNIKGSLSIYQVKNQKVRNSGCFFVFVYLAFYEGKKNMYMPLSQIFQLCCNGLLFFWWKKPEYMDKTIDLLQVTVRQHIVVVEILQSLPHDLHKITNSNEVHKRSIPACFYLAW